MIWKYLLTWVPGIPIAILNALLRTSVYRKFLNELQAHQLSGLSFMLFFGIYVWFVLKLLKIPSGQAAVQLGLLWLGLTIVFEFLFGHFVMGHPWSTLFQDYNLLAGRVWAIVLLWIAFAPVLLYRLQMK